MKTEPKSIKDFVNHVKENKVTDYNNINCENCNDCCGAFTFISQEEFDNLKNYFTKNKLGKITYERAISRVLDTTKRLDALCLKCPLSNGKLKCDIYNKRPAICRDFHCYTSENKVTEENKNTYGNRYIFDLFKEDLFKDESFRKRFKATVGAALKLVDNDSQPL